MGDNDHFIKYLHLQEINSECLYIMFKKNLRPN